MGMYPVYPLGWIIQVKSRDFRNPDDNVEQRALVTGMWGVASDMLFIAGYSNKY